MNIWLGIMPIVENARVRRWFLQLQEILHWKLWNLFKVIIITHWPHTETVKTLWWQMNYNFKKFYTKKKYCFKINNAGLYNCIELKTLFKIINFDHNFWLELSKNIHFQHFKKSLTKELKRKKKSSFLEKPGLWKKIIFLSHKWILLPNHQCWTYIWK